MKELNYYVPYLNANEVDKLKKGMQSYFRFIKPEVTFDLRNKMLYIQLGDGIDPKKWIEIGAYVNGFYQNYLD